MFFQSGSDLFFFCSLSSVISGGFLAGKNILLTNPATNKSHSVCILSPSYIHDSVDTKIIKTIQTWVYIKTPWTGRWWRLLLQSRWLVFLFLLISLYLFREFSTSARPLTSIRNWHLTAQVNKSEWIFSCSAPSTLTSHRCVRTSKTQFVCSRKQELWVSLWLILKRLTW